MKVQLFDVAPETKCRLDTIDRKRAVWSHCPLHSARSIGLYEPKIPVASAKRACKPVIAHPSSVESSYAKFKSGVIVSSKGTISRAVMFVSFI